MTRTRCSPNVHFGCFELLYTWYHNTIPTSRPNCNRGTCSNCNPRRRPRARTRLVIVWVATTLTATTAAVVPRSQLAPRNTNCCTRCCCDARLRGDRIRFELESRLRNSVPVTYKRGLLTTHRKHGSRTRIQSKQLWIL